MNRIVQYISIVVFLTAIVGSVWYFNSTASTKINSSQETKLTDGLVGNWTFDGNHMDWSQAAVVRDQAGSAHGTLVGMDSSNMTIGKVGQGINFDSSTANDRVAVTTSGIGSSNNITITAWVKPSAIGTYDGIMTSRNGVNQGLLLSGSAGNPLAYLWDDTTDEHNAASGLSLTTGEWQLVAMVVDPTKTTLYVNESRWTNTKTHNAKSMNVAWRIGEDQWAGEWEGKIDEVRLYNRSLTADEINQLYMMGK